MQVEFLKIWRKLRGKKYLCLTSDRKMFEKLDRFPDKRLTHNVHVSTSSKKEPLTVQTELYLRNLREYTRVSHVAKSTQRAKLFRPSGRIQNSAVCYCVLLISRANFADKTAIKSPAVLHLPAKSVDFSSPTIAKRSEICEEDPFVEKARKTSGPGS